MTHGRTGRRKAEDEPWLVLPENRFATTALQMLATSSNRDAPHVSDDRATTRFAGLFLQGPSGSGKSHLVRWGTKCWLAAHPDSKRWVNTASEFAAGMAEASAHEQLPAFLAPFRELDWFVLEDIHALAGRTETLQQLQFLWDELLAQGKRCVVTSARYPGELDGFPAKLRDRFRGATLAPLRLPGTESRHKLLTHFAHQRKVLLPEEVSLLLAEQLPLSPRELLSTILQLEAYSRQHKSLIDERLAQAFLAQEVLPPQTTLGEIAQAVARHFQLTLADLRSSARRQALALPRQCALFLSRELTGHSLTQIGEYYGNRDHSTVLHACRKIATLLDQDETLRRHLNHLRHRLVRSSP